MRAAPDAPPCTSRAIVIITSPDPEELVRLCDRVLVLRGGMIACELSGSNLTTSRIVTETLGATSLRAGTRVVERKLGFSVIRDDAPATTHPQRR